MLRQAVSRILRDCRFATRSLKRVPVFVVGVVATIALALGLNSSVFTIFNAYVLRPLPVADPGTLQALSVVGHSGSDEWTDSWVDWRQFGALRAMGGPVVDAAAHRVAYVRIHEGPAVGVLVSGNYFSMLGVHAARGRTIGPADAGIPGEDAVIVLSHHLWRTRFGGDPDIVGRTIPIRGREFTVVGVVGPDFTGLREVMDDFWAPVTMTAALDGDASARGDFPRIGVLVRLAPGADPRAAESLIGARLAAATAGEPPERRIVEARLAPKRTAIPMTAELVVMITPIAVAFLLVLVIACANVANMMLARGLARQRELGIRMALGAARRQVVAQLLSEAFLLALPAAALGLLISHVSLDLAVRWMFATFPPAFSAWLRVADLSPDVRVFGFMVAAAMASTLIFGLAPALQATRHNVIAATRGDLEGGWRASRLRDALVVSQVAACLLLLVVAGVLLRGAARARTIDTGLRTAGLIQMDVSDALRDPALDELRRMPEVATMAAAKDPPVAGSFTRTALRRSGGDAVHTVRFNRISSDYFELLGMRMLAGRTFTDAEERDHQPVVVLSETAARRLVPDGGAVGLEVTLTDSEDELSWSGLKPFRTARVIGVVSDAVAGMVFTGRQVPIAYYPMSVHDAGARLVLSARGPLDQAARNVEQTLDRRVPGALNEIYSVEQSLETQVYPIRAASWVSGLLGMIALLLTLSGIYGVLSYVVTQRTGEIGVRMALGATPRDVTAIVVKQALRLAAIGGAVGLVLALGVSRIFASQLEVVSTFDTLAYVGSAIAALGAALVGAWIPARRAASVGPLEALRRST